MSSPHEDECRSGTMTWTYTGLEPSLTPTFTAAWFSRTTHPGTPAGQPPAAAAPQGTPNPEGTPGPAPNPPDQPAARLRPPPPDGPTTYLTYSSSGAPPLLSLHADLPFLLGPTEAPAQPDLPPPDGASQGPGPPTLSGDPHGKIVSLTALLGLRAAYRQAGRSVVWTNGCFDLLVRRVTA